MTKIFFVLLVILPSPTAVQFRQTEKKTGKMFRPCPNLWITVSVKGYIFTLSSVELFGGCNPSYCVDRFANWTHAKTYTLPIAVLSLSASKPGAVTDAIVSYRRALGLFPQPKPLWIRATTAVLCVCVFAVVR